MYTLRPYQQQAVDSMLELFTSRRHDAGLVVIPTSGGKGLCPAYVAKELNEPLLIFQPTKEILIQNYNKMMDYGVYGVSIYSASMKSKEIGNITLATIGSVKSKTQLFKNFKHVIVDECHFLNSKVGVYKNFLEVVGDKLIGLTATPYRSNTDRYGGTMMKFLTRTNPRILNKVIHVTQTSYLADNGYFAKTEYFNIKGFNRREIQLNSTGADYLEPSERAYYDKIHFSDEVYNIVNRVLKSGKKRILVFTKFVQEAVELADRLGNEAAWLSGETPSDERDKLIKRFKNGDVKVICNCGVLTVGFDYPELEVVILARPTRSLSLYTQMVGRCVRPHPLKESAWIIDLCGNYEIFGRVEDMEVVDQGSNQWQVISKGRPLTNVYLDKIMDH